MKTNNRKVGLAKTHRDDKENVSSNIVKRISAANVKPTSSGPTKAKVKSIEAVVTPKRDAQAEPTEKKEGGTEEEVKLPVDDFVINGICAHKVQATKRALAIVNPPDVTKTKGMASPFSPLSDIQSYKAGTRVQDVIRPTPQIIDFAKEAMVKHMKMKSKERRNDTLDCTWDKKKDESCLESSFIHDEMEDDEEGDGVTNMSSVERMLAHEQGHEQEGEEKVEAQPDAQCEMRALSDANQELEKALFEAKVKCARIDEVSTINENISRVATSLRADRDGKALEVNALQNKLREAKDTIKLLQNQITSLDNLNSQLCEEMASNQTILENKSARLEEMQELVIGASPIQSPLKDELESYSRQLSAKESEVHDLKREVASMADAAVENRRAAQTATEELHVLQVKYNEVREQLHGHQSAHGEQEEEWQARFQAKEMALEHAETELSTMRRKLEAKEDELMTLLHSSVQSSDIATAKLQKERETLIAVQSELETANERLARLTEIDVDRSAEFDALRTALTAEIKALTDEKSELRQSCNGYRISLDSTRERLRSLETAIQAGQVSMRSPSVNRDSTHSSPASDTFASPADNAQGVSDKARIVALEADLRTARDLLVQFSRSKDDKIASMEALLSALEEEEAEEGENESTNDDGTVSTATHSVKLERGLVKRFLKSEERCKELLLELTSSQEEHDKAQRTIKHLTEEFERSKALLEKQLSSSSSSTGELAHKMCDMNEKVEHLMQYSLKLTEELTASKESESHLQETVDSMRVQIEAVKRERDLLSGQLHDVTHQVDIMSTLDEIPPAEREGEGGEMDSDHPTMALTYDLQKLQREVKEKDDLLTQWESKYSEMSRQMETAAITLEKAKTSKVKRYNKYVALQNEYKNVVAQVRKLLAENGDLKARHKTFVRTVEQTLVGGEGKAALAENFSSAGQATMAVPTVGNFNDFAWSAPTPGHSEGDTTASTVASYHHTAGLHTGSTITSVVTPGDMLDTNSSKPTTATSAVAFHDLAFEFGEEEE